MRCRVMSETEAYQRCNSIEFGRKWLHWLNWRFERMPRQDRDVRQEAVQ